MPKIFIDTNVFLDFYKSRQESISILLELKKHSKSIVLSSLVYDEFLRRRVGILNEVIKGIKKEYFTYTTPIIEDLNNFNDLEKIRKKHKKQLGIVENKIQEIINDTQKDSVYCEVTSLYKTKNVKIFKHDDDIIQKANKRHMLGQPPGTSTINICDEVIWETILLSIDTDLIILSGDSSFKDNYFYLSQEFENKTNKKLLKIASRISEGIELLGQKVPKEIVELEEKQIEDIRWGVKEKVETVLATLTPREEKVLRMRFGIDGSGKEEPYINLLRAIFSDLHLQNGDNDNPDR